MHLIIELMKYLMIFLLAIYTYYSFTVFRYKNKKSQGKLFGRMTVILFLLHFTGYSALFLQIPSMKLVFLYAGEVILFATVLLIYQTIYPKISKLLMRNMLMLLSIGFLMLTRLSYDKALKQVLIVAAAFLVCFFVPYVFSVASWLRKFGWFYGISGIGLLLVVLLFGINTNGATNWIEVKGFRFQPSEFIKILFVLSIAALLSGRRNFTRICAITLMAAVNVMILVVQKDLGGALIFFVTYIFMLYVATMKPLYLFAGLISGSAASYVAYHLFNHVRVRVMAWRNPFQYIDKEGYQISQSLFAIGTGGWFGMGLNKGLPTSIPVVDSDFIFSAIAEELGGFFAICVILILVSCFVLFINTSLQVEDVFYRLLSLGLGVMFGFQVFLSIGGVIKFIPSTGVTLPLISYGGTSIFVTVFMFMLLQGIYKNAKTPSNKEGESEVKDYEK